MFLGALDDHEVDFSNWSAFVQQGILYCSPNCSRPVVIPQLSGDPFKRSHLRREMFQQPVWWSDVWGWLCAVPLSPSFISPPFEPMCWKPEVEETWFRKSYHMREQDAKAWLEKEVLLFEATQKIRLRYRIPGNPPPRPSAFGYNRPHKSKATAWRMINMARDWFSIWMGFLSYLIAQTVNYANDPEDNAGLHCWYRLLLDRGFSDAWLSGLMGSTVNSFDAATPRAGIVMQLTEQQVAHPKIEWFLAHHIPVWFVWSKREEE
ncbi:hypothetical protein CPB84DRAFT_1690636, partial [Gymnopilus junonius]